MNPFKVGTKPYLFYELAAPNKDGVSRWVSKTEFTGKYSPLMFNNGADWCRKESSIAQKFIVEFDKNVTNGPGVDRIRLNGFKTVDDLTGKQGIKSSIKAYYRNKPCIVLATSDPETDHKNGWKNDPRVMNIETQTLNDFQPLSKAANDAKRQICKECRRTKKRFDAKILGYPMSFYSGNDKHDGTPNGCIGCFWYDVAEFRRHLEFKK